MSKVDTSNQDKCDDCRKLYQDIDVANHDNSARLKEYVGKVEIVNNELVKLNSKLREKQAENDDLRIKNSQLQTQLKNQAILQTELDTLKGAVQSRNQEIEGLRQNKVELNNIVQELRDQLGQLLEYQNKVAMLSSEIERQNKKLGNREKEIALLTEKVADQDARIEELLKIENDKYQLENKVAMLASEIERQQNLIKNKERTNVELSKRIQDQENQISQLSLLQNDIEALSRQLVGRDNDIEEWKQRYEKLASIEVLYNEANDKVYNLENKVAMLSSEIERQQQKINNRTKELDELKQKYQAFEATLQQYQGTEAENQRLKEHLQECEKAVDEWKTKSLSQAQDITAMHGDLNSYATDQVALIKERDGAVEVVNNLKKELDETRAQFGDLQEELRVAQEWQFKVSNLENKVAMLSSEIERLSKMVENKNKELESLRGTISQQAAQIQELQSLQAELERVGQAHEEALKEIEGVQQLRKQITDELEQVLGEKNNFENKIAMLSTEIERMQFKLKNRVEEAERLNLRILDLENELKEKAQLPSDVERLTGLVDELRSAHAKSEAQVHDLEGQLNETTQQRELVENKLAMLSSEIERLGKLNSQKTAEIEGLKQHVHELEEQVLELQKSEQKMFEYETKLAFLSQEIERQNNQYKVKLGELDNVKVALATAEKQILDQEALQHDLQRLDEVIKTKIAESDGWRQKVEGLENNLIKLEDIKFQYENKIALLSSEIERQTKKYKNIETLNEEINKQRTANEAEVDQVHRALQEREKELDDLRKQYPPQLDKLQFSLQQQQLVLVLSFAENESLRKRVLDVNQELEQLRKVRLVEAKS